MADQVNNQPQQNSTNELAVRREKLNALYESGKASSAAAKLRERFAAMENLRIFTEGKEF